MRHDGQQPGYLYEIDEPLEPSDIYPHPHPCNVEEWEWVTTRDLRVRLLGETVVQPEESLTAAEVADLCKRNLADETG